MYLLSVILVFDNSSSNPHPAFTAFEKEPQAFKLPTNVTFSNLRSFFFFYIDHGQAYACLLKEKRRNLYTDPTSCVNLSRLLSLLLMRFTSQVKPYPLLPKA